MSTTNAATVVAVSCSPSHAFSKTPTASIRLVRGLGVEGDAHKGVTVQHRSRVAKDANQPNLRQVHLIHHELLDELGVQGFELSPGELGENITTRGVDLLALCRGARLHFADGPVVEIAGLRNPCNQIEHHQAGLLTALLGRDAQGALIRKAGVMGIVVKGGPVHTGDSIAVALPSGARPALETV